MEGQNSLQSALRNLGYGVQHDRETDTLGDMQRLMCGSNLSQRKVGAGREVDITHLAEIRYLK